MWDFSQTIDSHPTTTKGYCYFMVAYPSGKCKEEL